jgi:hypothetical protein
MSYGQVAGGARLPREGGVRVPEVDEWRRDEWCRDEWRWDEWRRDEWCRDEWRWDEWRWDEWRWDEWRWDEWRWDDRGGVQPVDLGTNQTARSPSKCRSQVRRSAPWAKAVA